MIHFFHVIKIPSNQFFAMMHWEGDIVPHHMTRVVMKLNASFGSEGSANNHVVLARIAKLHDGFCRTRGGICRVEWLCVQQ
jgi:hypothetical protein